MRRRAGKAQAGLTGPAELAAAEPLVLLGGDEAEKDALFAATSLAEEENKSTIAIGGSMFVDGDDDGHVSSGRALKFRTLAHLYKITHPQRLQRKFKSKKKSRT